jgi:replicative DNA helicase
MAPEVSMERQLPQNLEAERSVLGAILLDNHALNLALEKLKPEDFFDDHHRRIFNQMIELGEAQQAIDLVTLSDILSRKGELEAAGGAAYIAQLVDGVPRISHLEHYAHIVKQKALLRSVIHAAHGIQQTALDAEEDADAVLDQAESTIFQIAEDRVRAGLVPMREVVQESMQRLERVMAEGKRITGLATGYSQLDNLTSGLQPSELIILAARPSVGKTAFALNIAENAAMRNNAQVAIFSLEMSKDSLLMRLLASQARIDAHKFRTGHFSKEDWRQMTHSLSLIAETPLWIDDSGSATVTEIGAKARRL